jgi:hypothetical protein
MLAGIPHGSDATRQSTEVSGVEVQMTMIIAQSTIQRQVIKCLTDGGIGAKIEEFVLWNQRLFAQIQ